MHVVSVIHVMIFHCLIWLMPWSSCLLAWGLVCFLDVLICQNKNVRWCAIVILDSRVSWCQLSYLIVMSCTLLVAYFGISCDDHPCLQSYRVYCTIAFVVCMSFVISIISSCCIVVCLAIVMQVIFHVLWSSMCYSFLV